MQKIAPCLWFTENAEEAIHFYLSIFKDSKILNKNYYPKGNGHGPEGALMFVEFELAGQRYQAINAFGDRFPFNYAVSLSVTCEDQKEVDYFWEKLREGGGEEIECGWLEDRFGLPWQIVPKVYQELMRDPKKADEAQLALLTMKKPDVATFDAIKRGGKKAA